MQYIFYLETVRGGVQCKKNRNLHVFPPFKTNARYSTINWNIYKISGTIQHISPLNIHIHHSGIWSKNYTTKNNKTKTFLHHWTDNAHLGRLSEWKVCMYVCMQKSEVQKWGKKKFFSEFIDVGMQHTATCCFEMDFPLKIIVLLLIELDLHL